MKQIIEQLKQRLASEVSAQADTLAERLRAEPKPQPVPVVPHQEASKTNGRKSVAGGVALFAGGYAVYSLIEGNWLQGILAALAAGGAVYLSSQMNTRAEHTPTGGLAKEDDYVYAKRLESIFADMLRSTSDYLGSLQSENEALVRQGLASVPEDKRTSILDKIVLRSSIQYSLGTLKAGLYNQSGADAIESYMLEQAKAFGLAVRKAYDEQKAIYQEIENLL